MFLSPDLHHIEIIPGTSECSRPQRGRPGSITLNQSQGLAIAAIPPVSPGFVEKIESGAFVEMVDLVPQ